jgi:hypothetical protein
MVVVGTPKCMRSFGGRKYSWEGNIKIDLKELGIVCSLHSSGSG